MPQKRLEWVSVETYDYPKGVPIAVCNKREEWIDIAFFQDRLFKSYKYPHSVLKPTHYSEIPIDFPI